MSRRYNLGSNQDAQIAEQLVAQTGGAIGQAVAALAQIAGFAGKVHTTPSGATYHQATSIFKSNELAIEGLIAQYNAAHGMAPPNFPPPPSNGDSPAYYQWMSARVAAYLNQPSLVTSSAKAYDKLKSGGAFDSAIQVQNAVLQQLANGAAPSSVAGAVSTTTAGAAPDLSTLLLYGVGAIVLLKVLGG